MKKSPYIEIIDLNAERKEYASLCNGKSKKYRLYTDWEKHIRDLLSSFSKPKDLYNFKRYCINAARSQEKLPDIFLGYISLLIPIYLDTCFDEIPSVIIFLSFWIIITYVAIQNKRLTRESFFFKDLLEIIETIDHTHTIEKKVGLHDLDK